MFDTLKKSVGAVALAALMAVGAATSANAAVIQPGDPAVVLVPGTILTSIQTFDDTGVGIVNDTYNYTTFDDGTGQQNVAYKYDIIFEEEDITDFANLTFSIVGEDQGPLSSFELTDAAGNLAAFVSGFSFSFVGVWDAPQNIFLTVTGDVLEAGATYGIRISAVPLPAPLLLFVSALFGLGFLGRRRLNA